MNNEKEIQALVKKLSKASAKKALDKEKAEVVSSAVGCAQKEIAKRELWDIIAPECLSKNNNLGGDSSCSLTGYACKDYSCPKLKHPKQ